MSVFADFLAIVSCAEDIENDDLEWVLSSNEGCHSKITSLINDELFRVKAFKYVRENGYKKGEPNLTLLMFCKWVEESQGIKICESTASAWLH